MDWTDKLEHKKKIRKMAYRMLWADFKEVVLSWKVVLLLLMYLGFFLLPYVAKDDDFNAASMYYFVVWVILALNALVETSFNYLPLSTKDIKTYLKIRTNHQTAWMVFISVMTGIILDACGVDVFWERGIMVLIFLLVTVEWMFFLTLYSYGKQDGVSFLAADFSTSKKVRIALYHVYGLGMLFTTMFVAMFMDDNENAKTKVIVMLCAFLVMYISRADAIQWVRIEEYKKMPRRSMWGNVEQTNQK